MKFLNKLSLAFAAGSVGGLLNSLVLWIFGAVGLNQFLGGAAGSGPDAGFSLPPPGLGRPLGFPLPPVLAHAENLPGRAAIQPRAHPGAIVLRLSVQGRQRFSGIATRTADPSPGGIVQCRLGSGRRLVVVFNQESKVLISKTGNRKPSVMIRMPGSYRRRPIKLFQQDQPAQFMRKREPGQGEALIGRL